MRPKLLAVTAAAFLNILPLQGMDRSQLDACEAVLSLKYDECKKQHTAQECNMGITTRLCSFGWNETYGAFIDRRIEEVAAEDVVKIFKKAALPGALIGVNKIKAKYVVAGGK